MISNDISNRVCVDEGILQGIRVKPLEEQSTMLFTMVQPMLKSVRESQSKTYEPNKP